MPPHWHLPSHAHGALAVASAPRPAPGGLVVAATATSVIVPRWPRWPRWRRVAVAVPAPVVPWATTIVIPAVISVPSASPVAVVLRVATPATPPKIVPSSVAAAIISEVALAWWRWRWPSRAVATAVLLAAWWWALSTSLLVRGGQRHSHLIPQVAWRAVFHLVDRFIARLLVGELNECECVLRRASDHHANNLPVLLHVLSHLILLNVPM
mmetsp:Transcript_41375/g.88155  ORF Transcript_41375/g.88155 Transcript_41375/m.88155 type:complete len:211 (-) Transcript_41375:160-792(-)